MSTPKKTDPVQARLDADPYLTATPDGKGGYTYSRRYGGGGSRNQPGKPRTQYWGGSKEAYEAARGEAALEAETSRVEQAGARRDLKATAATEAGKLEGLAGKSDAFAEANRTGFRNTTNQVLRGASDLERLGARAAQDYKQTSDAQFRNQQDANQRAALSMGAVGGASGVRSALAASSQANAQAQAASAVTQAQELNNIRQQEQNAVAQAAGLRGNVAGLQNDAASKAAAERFAAQNAASGMVGNAATFEASAAQDLYKTDSEAEREIEIAQLNANREREAQRLQWRQNRIKQFSLGLV